MLAVAGTRPEVIKLAPVVRAPPRARLDVSLGLSGQHGELARRAASELGLVAAFELPAPEGSLDLSGNLARLMVALDAEIERSPPGGVLVQGDTTTTLAAALAAFHRGVPVFHVEAGLRTGTPDRPFPEEMNRRLVGRLAALHFSPTEGARGNLLREGVDPASVVVTGNTVIDALELAGRDAPAAARLLERLDGRRPKLLVTLHRRENEAAAPALAGALLALARRGEVDVVWLAHPNPTSRAAVGVLGAPVLVVPPQPYATFVALLSHVDAVLTDSGGVQEEAPALGVPVVVLRRETDRPESVATGNAVVAGDDPVAVVACCREIFGTAGERERRSRIARPFGDGRAAARILDAVERYFFA